MFASTFLRFLKSPVFPSRRLLVDMVPRIRQTRNYERFEWRTGGRRGGLGRDGRGLTNWLMGWGTGITVPPSLSTDNRIESFEVPAEASVSVQSSHSKIWTEDPGRLWQRRRIKFPAPFKCFTIWCTYNIFICLLTVNGAVLSPYLNKRVTKIERELS